MTSKQRVLSYWLLACSFICPAQASLDQWLKSNVPEMGGRAVLVIYKDGQMVYNHAENNMSPRQKMAFNYVARKQGKEADLSDFSSQSKIAIASCSKWLSAALVMTFVDEGRINLSDTVGTYLPVLSKNGKGHITIGQCLAHLTGIATPPLKDDLGNYKQSDTMDEIMEEIAQLPMEGTPGEVFHYGNTGLQIAAAVVEKAGGKSFQELFAERIARPLEMDHTDFGTARVPLAAGGALSTADDYLKFLSMILNKGLYHNKRILSEQSIASMQRNYITSEMQIAYSPAQGEGAGYGLGEWIMGPGYVSSPGLFGSFPWVDYEKHYAAFLMTLYVNPDGRSGRYGTLKKLVDAQITDL